MTSPQPPAVTLTLSGLPGSCPHCGDKPAGGSWPLAVRGTLLVVACPSCHVAAAPVRAVAVPETGTEEEPMEPLFTTHQGRLIDARNNIPQRPRILDETGEIAPDEAYETALAESLAAADLDPDWPGRGDEG